MIRLSLKKNGLKSVYSWAPNDQAFSEKNGVEIGIFLGPKFQQIKLSLKNMVLNRYIPGPQISTDQAFSEKMVLKSVYSWAPNFNRSSFL